jgi:hypothetical protein
MPVPIKKVNKNKGLRTLKMKFGEDTLNIVYDRSKYTPKAERELNERVAEQNLIGSLFSGFLGQLVVGWDIMDVHPEDTEKAENLENSMETPPGMKDYENAGIRMVPVPLTDEAFDAFLSIEFQGELMIELGKDQRPNQKTSDSMNNF